MADKKRKSPVARRAVPVHSRVAPKLEGAEFTEIKATVDGRNIATALRAFNLRPKEGEQRFVYFFDTAKLALNKARVVVRARRIPGHQHDSTIKIRPVNPADVAKWKNAKGFKIEADAGSAGIVLSASLTRPVEKGQIKKLGAGDDKLAAIFDKEQEQFLAEMCRIPYKLSALERFGPIDVIWWKHTYPGLPAPMTAELWTRGDGAELLELSIRVASDIAAFAAGGFLAFLADLGAKPDNASQAKTKWAMEYHGKAAKTSGTIPASGTSAESASAMRAAKAKSRAPKTVRKAGTNTAAKEKASSGVKSAHAQPVLAPQVSPIRENSPMTRLASRPQVPATPESNQNQNRHAERRGTTRSPSRPSRRTLPENP